MSKLEQLLMVLVTVITNLLALPALYVLHLQQQTFPLYMGGYTVLCSFMYHLSESLQVNSLYLDHVAWHRLDNIGSITSLVSLMIYFLDLERGSQGVLPLQLLGLFVVLTMQAQDPWRLLNTFAPILIFLSAALVRHLFVTPAHLNRQILGLGVGFMAVAFVCFIKGLKHDYLRIWHGLWHFFGGFAMFYLWQAVDATPVKNHPISFAEAVCALCGFSINIADGHI